MKGKLLSQTITSVLFSSLIVVSLLVTGLSPAWAQTSGAQTARDPGGPARPSDQPNVPLTWRDEYFPQFHIRIKDEDLAQLLVKGNTGKYAMTLTYQGKDYVGTIKLRLGNTSVCADKRQFRLDLPQKTTFPDGYIADRFETDHGNGFTLHEWLAWKMLAQAANKRPTLKILRKKANVVAIYFNDKLYHVQTLVEDVGKDLLEPQLGTRNITTFKHGCMGLTGPSTIDKFCQTFSPAQIQASLDIPSFMYATAAMEVIGSYDNYPRFPYNYYWVQENSTGRMWYLPDDLDSTIFPQDTVYANPFHIAYSVGDSQRHFTEMVKDRGCLELYYSYVNDLSTLWEPNQVKPQLAAKYAQVRATLLASGGLPYDQAYYDYLYNLSLPLWVELRYAYLTRMMKTTSIAEVSKEVANQQ